MAGVGQIVVIEQHPKSRLALRLALQEQGYIVHNMRTAQAVLECVLRSEVEAIILSANPPHFDIKRICRAIRSASDVPLIVLARSYSVKERTAVLDAGADDCLETPFHMIELLARIRAVLRRVHAVTSCREELRLQDLHINLVTRQVISRGKAVHLTPMEFDLLRYLINNPNMPIPHSRILQSVWGPGQCEHLRVFINQLRKKIEPDPAHPRYLLTEPWIGYRFALPGM